MPLNEPYRVNVLRYCDRDVPTGEQINDLFDFVVDKDLRVALVKEYRAARYIYKLGEALNVSDEKLAAHAKFQIVQYASIYEAVIIHVLWYHFPKSPEVDEIQQFTTLRRAGSLPINFRFREQPDQQVHLCVESKSRNPQQSIKFDDKVRAAVALGFVSLELGDEIKEIFRIRNGVHIENAVKKEIQYEIDQSQLAYRRIQPFTDGIRRFLALRTCSSGSTSG